MSDEAWEQEFRRLGAQAVKRPATMEHRWFHPHRGSNLRCRSCGLWHGVWTGDGCPGEQDWPQPYASVSWSDDDLERAIPLMGYTVIWARLRVYRHAVGDVAVHIDRFEEAPASD